MNVHFWIGCVDDWLNSLYWCESIESTRFMSLGYRFGFLFFLLMIQVWCIDGVSSYIKLCRFAISSKWLIFQWFGWFCGLGLGEEIGW